MADNSYNDYTHTYDPVTCLWTETATRHVQALMPLNGLISQNDYNNYTSQQNNCCGEQCLDDVCAMNEEVNT